MTTTNIDGSNPGPNVVTTTPYVGGGGPLVRVGNVTSDLVAFYGVTGSAQRASAAQVALTTALASVTVTGAYGFALSSGYSALIAQVEEIRATLVALGLMKGSA